VPRSRLVSGIQGPPSRNIGADQKRSKENLKRIGEAIHKFVDTNNVFPTAAIYGKKNNMPLLSWRVSILPFLNEQALYKEFKLDEPWDSLHNKALLAKMPNVYAPPGIKTKEPNATFYQVFVGAGTLFDQDALINFRLIKDGTSNTIMAIEAGEAVPWTKPQDLPFDPGKDLPRLGGIFENGFHFLAADGFVHYAKKSFDPKKMCAAITRAGGEVLDITNLEP